jgi:hypothetical protein
MSCLLLPSAAVMPLLLQIAALAASTASEGTDVVQASLCNLQVQINAAIDRARVLTRALSDAQMNEESVAEQQPNSVHTTSTAAPSTSAAAGTGQNPAAAAAAAAAGLGEAEQVSDVAAAAAVLEPAATAGQRVTPLKRSWSLFSR